MLLKPVLFGLFEEHAPICVECFEGILELAVLEDHLSRALAVGVEFGGRELFLQAREPALGGVYLALDRDEAGGEDALLFALSRTDPSSGAAPLGALCVQAPVRAVVVVVAEVVH